MWHSEQIEVSRLEVQKRLDSAKTQNERNKLGQFATPTALAREILGFTKTLLPTNIKIRFLDPAFGTGSFYSALLKTFPRSRIKSAIGYEIDKQIAASAAQLWNDDLLKLKRAEFTSQRAPSSDTDRANLLICNPPYVRHHHLSGEDKNRLRIAVRQSLGINLSGLSGFYCYFMCLSHSWMAEDGVAAWLVPSEFMDVNYGRAIKDYLLNHVTLLRIHRFDPADVQFDDALVSSAVVWFKKKKPVSAHRIEFTLGGTLLKPAASFSISSNVVRDAVKWTRLPQSGNGLLRTESENKLSDLFSIKRGVATGANKFFILSAERIAELKLPRKFLIPILPSAKYLSTNEILVDADGDPILERKQYLLSCKLPEAEVAAKYPSLSKYLESGKREGIHEKYLSRHRSPWYSQEERESPLFLCTYINRKAFRFILNHSKAIAANVYLLLYPKKELAAAIKQDPELVLTLWTMLKSITPEALRQAGRVYGGELYKLEPKELGNVPVGGIIEDSTEIARQRVVQKKLW